MGRLVQELGPFELHPGVYYLNSIEWAASAMEMSALAGWNVANLAAKAGTKGSRHQQQNRESDRETALPIDRLEL